MKTLGKDRIMFCPYSYSYLKIDFIPSPPGWIFHFVKEQIFCLFEKYSSSIDKLQ